MRFVIPATVFLLLGAAAASDQAMEGRIARLDGALGDAEANGVTLTTLEDGARIVAEVDGPYLWIRIQSEEPGVVSLCLAEGSRVTVLHASAALGMVRYEPTDSGWSRRGEFDWAMRDTTLGAEALAARRQHLEEHGWVATTAHMGDPNLFEFLIRRDRLIGDGARLALGIMPMKPPHTVFGVPSASAGDCAHDELVKGPPPQSGLKFDTTDWLPIPPT